jgi:hypothetical protein
VNYLAIGIACGSFAGAIITVSLNAMHWQKVVGRERKRSDFFYAQYVDLVKRLEAQDASHE